ncbi:zinc finger protein 91-like [Aricia agestis]|uniref:zinc finger protein 91-like n=1 Tax=Aricia agestis TaxID=91739 RepID=UPI001C20B70D|nr:zinc finger protein 91-like [Aricia agestis]
MREININIEGFNVNGICVGCLNYNRKMFYREEVKECFKLLANIDISDGLTIQVCWECLAAVKNALQFRAQISNAFDILLDYSNKHTFLDSPEDLSCYATQRLAIKKIPLSPTESTVKEETDNNDVKEEVDEKINPEVTFMDKPLVETTEVKVESDFFENNEGNEFGDLFNNDDRMSSDDDKLLSQIKSEPAQKKKKKIKVKKKRKQEKELEKNKLSNRLKNLPSDLVELYTMTEAEMWEVRAMDVSNTQFQKLRFKCELCIMSFNTKALLDTHNNGKHSAKSKNMYQCDVCKSNFLTKDNVSVHRSLHLQAFKCRECGLITSMKRIMMSHNCNAAECALAFACNMCDEKFTTKWKLSYHKSSYHQENPQCDCCGKVFANKLTLKYHLKLLPQNKSDKEKEKLFIPCKGCDKVFHSKKSYRAHVVIHDGLSYPCPTCGKMFQWKRNLARHVRNHRDRDAGTTHACRDCGKSFASRDCYNNHMKLSKRHVHEQAYAHTCHFCGKKFPTKWCMVDHIDWEHLKRIKYQCNVCFKAFKTAKIMVAHMQNIHEGRNKRDPDSEHDHLCDICGKSYKTVKRLKGHVWAMHTQRSDAKTYKCALCPATFAWQTSIYKHMKMMHDNKRNKTPRALSTAKKVEAYPTVELTNRMQYFQQNVATNVVQNIVQNVPSIQTINIVQNI